MITLPIARKVLETVDAGLCQGKGVAKPGEMCVEAAVCYALGLPHSDDPPCVSRALRSLKIDLNDSGWSSDAARAKGLRRLALAQLGSRDALDDVEFAKRVALMAVKKLLPPMLRRAGLESEALKCEEADTLDAACDAACDAARDAAYAASDEAYAARYAARDAADAAYAARYAARDAARYAASYAAYAARYAASYAARDAARDKTLSDFAEEVVQILIAMNAPGCQWLRLTEKEAK